jgi:hypothetical protein
VIPDRNKLPSAPDDWPDNLEPGSLNVGVAANGWPSEFTGVPSGKGAQKLDSRRFPPAFIIPHDKIGGNFTPTPENPDKGTAQVWRAVLRASNPNRSRKVWILRRIGSGLKAQIEIVSDVRLKDVMSLADGVTVEVEMEYGETT